MRILITNDDGYQSEGLKILARALRERNEVTILAPDSDRSGTSHSMSLKGSIRIRKIGEGEFTCSGTPADCTIVSQLGALPEKPEIVISGVNRGANLGTDIIYSGTVAAARQAALMGKPAIAVSLVADEGPYYYEPVCAFVARNLDTLLSMWHPDTFININAPNTAGGWKEIAVTWPARRRYHDQLKTFDAPDGTKYCFFTDGWIETIPEAGSDCDAVAAGNLSVSLVYLHPVEHENDRIDPSIFK